jgi:hypothetical protein
MRAFASSFHAWRSIEEQEGIKVPHGLVFPLAVVEAIGRPHGLTMTAEEHEPTGPSGFDAIMISVLDSRCMVGAAAHFRSWGVPFRRADRGPLGRWPLVWAGGQGLHNPLPMAPVFDLAVIGDGEDAVPELLRLWERHGNSDGFLAAASMVPGVFVPEHHDRRDITIVQAVSADVGITLREEIDVSHNRTRRLEIARGCRYKCTFCSLGWRTPMRENSADDVLVAIRKSSRLVHLQAGDAESHSGIDEIRRGLREHGGFDQGWTGRLDTLLDNPDQTIPGQKRYAFGVEGVSYRLRAAVGKGYLTDERLVNDTIKVLSITEGEGKGRAAWHVIAGLPTERVEEVFDLRRVIEEIDRGYARSALQHARASKLTAPITRHLTLHWQPFQPLPGTPMQWCAAGRGARTISKAFAGWKDMKWCRVRSVGGRTDEMALICSALARSDERGADLLEALASGPVSVRDAERISGSTTAALDPDEPLPWDFVRAHHDKATLQRAYDAMMRRFGAV